MAYGLVDSGNKIRLPDGQAAGNESRPGKRKPEGLKVPAIPTGGWLGVRKLGRAGGNLVLRFLA